MAETESSFDVDAETEVQVAIHGEQYRGLIRCILTMTHARLQGGVPDDFVLGAVVAMTIHRFQGPVV